MSAIASLPLFHAVAGQRVLVLGEGAAAEPKRRLVERAGGVVIDDPAQAVDEGVQIAFIAFEDAGACEAAAINCRCAGMLVNVVDRPELCDFTTPSILSRDPLLIAIGTGGASAGLAKHVRLRLERLLPATLGKLARALFAARPALRERFPDAGDRRRALDGALAQGGPLDPLDPASHDRVTDWIAAQLPDRAAGKPTVRSVSFAVTSEDPDDMTIHQARWLGEADTVCIEGAVPPAVLARARADARRVPCLAGSCPAARSADGSAACLRADGPRSGPSGPGEGETAPPDALSGGLTVALHWRPRGAGS